MDDAALRRYLKYKCEEAGSVGAFAEEAGVSRQTMSEIISGRMKPAPSVLVYLGLQRVVSYEFVKLPKKP